MKTKYLIVAEVEVDETYLKFYDDHPTMNARVCIESAFHYWQSTQGKARHPSFNAAEMNIKYIAKDGKLLDMSSNS